MTDRILPVEPDWTPNSGLLLDLMGDKGAPIAAPRLTSRCIRYAEGYKYQLRRTACIQVAIRPAQTIRTDWIELTADGWLTLQKGYAWDGPSGPAFDTPTFMRASAVHDALYQLLRLGLLAPELRAAADDEMHRICLEDGMWRLRAWWCHRGVRLGAGPAADPALLSPDLCAPAGCDCS